MSAQDLEQRASAQELRERITIILGSARKRIDGAAPHHGEQWVIGGRTAINFIKQKLHRLLSSVEQTAPVVDDARMARALEWVRWCADEFSGTLEEIALAKACVPAIEEAIAAYDPHCGARTVRVVDVLVAVRHEIEAAKHELDTVTATDDAQSDGIGCAENALDRALAILAGAQGVQS